MKYSFFLIFTMSTLVISAQQKKNNQLKTSLVVTAAPLLGISPDARSSGLGNQGVATSSDVFSQYWNASKYNFSSYTSGIGISYTPYLINLTSDLYLLNTSFFTQISNDKRSILGTSFYYFNIGSVNLNNVIGMEIINQGLSKPREFAVDLSYGLKIMNNYSMAITGRFIRSDLFNNINNNDQKNDKTKVANSYAIDLSGYYQGEEHNSFNNFNGKWRGGFQISNIGPKINYFDNNFSYLPTNLRFGIGYDLFLDDQNKVGLTFETSKLLVPFSKSNGTTTPNYGVIKGMIKSLTDTPGGMFEELKEITYSLSGEYVFNKIFSLYSGYFYESIEKRVGGRQFASLGIGLKYNSLGFNTSYLITTSKINSALDNTLRFGITWDIGLETDYNR